MTYIKEEV
jgi:hypothetical protein